jgi:hypothetical protein
VGLLSIHQDGQYALAFILAFILQQKQQKQIRIVNVEKVELKKNYHSAFSGSILTT